MIPLLRSEIFRLTRRLMPRILLLILAAVVLAFYLIFWAVSRSAQTPAQQVEVAELREGLQLNAVRAAGLGLVQSVGAVLVVILAASAIATEFGWGTIRTLLPRGAGRTPFLTAKLVALLLFLAVVVLLGYLVALGASIFVTALEDLDTGLGGDFLPQTLAALGRTAYVMLPYLALTFLVALWTRSTAAGIGIGLSVLFLEGLFTSLITLGDSPLERLPAALLSRNVDAVMAPNSAGLGGTFAQPATDLPDPWRAAGVLALYIAAFIGLAYWVFRRRDITAGAGG